MSSLQADLRKQKIALARIIGLPLDRELTLSEPLGFTQAAVPDTARRAMHRRFKRRSDLRAAEAQVRAAELALSAAHAERLPSASHQRRLWRAGSESRHYITASSQSPPQLTCRFGRVAACGRTFEQAEATLKQRRAELADQRGRVEQDVRTALIELETAMGQVQVAESNRGYANETLTEARDRFGAGVATTVEVVQAQEQVAGAESDYISSLFSFNLAKLTLARATGEAEADLPRSA